MPFSTIDVSKFKRPQGRSRRSLIITGGIAALIIVAAVSFYVFGNRSASSPASNAVAPTPNGTAKAAEAKPPASGTPQLPSTSQLLPVFDKQRFSVDDPASPWVVVNKRRPLQPPAYVPQLATPNVPLRLSAGASEMTLSSQVIPSLESMFAAARQAGVELMIASGYRSYSTQVVVYDNEVRNYGQATADTQSARPGHSEHQTGLAVDIEPASRQCEIQDCFGDLPEGKWLAANAHTYGFVMRYGLNNETVTGYRHESWHFRYVGQELAAELHRLGSPPLETFFGLGAAPGY